MVIFSIAELADWIFFFSSFLFKNLWTYQVIHQKPKKTLNEITKELCPVRASSFESLILYWTYFFSLHASFWCYCLWLHQVLSIQQLYRISTMYWDDKYGTHSVSSDVSFYGCHYSARFESSSSRSIKINYNTLNWTENMHLKTYLHIFFSFFNGPSRLYPIWECWWQKIPTMLSVILSCWMTIPGYATFNHVITLIQLCFLFSSLLFHLFCYFIWSCIS